MMAEMFQLSCEESMKRNVKRHAVTQPSDPTIRLIALTKNQVTLVDSSDYEFLMQRNWFAQWAERAKCFYARTNEKLESGRFRGLGMHNLLMGVSSDVDVDHINHDPLDNRRSNLRIATTSQNCCNRLMRSDNTSGFKGVSWKEKNKKWQAAICINGKTMYIGLFCRAEDAAKAYDSAAVKHHGEFAVLNYRDTFPARANG